MPLCKMLGLRGNEPAVGHSAVHEGKGGIARTPILEGQLDAIVPNCCHRSLCSSVQLLKNKF
jgi:hypothetical protein